MASSGMRGAGRKGKGNYAPEFKRQVMAEATASGVSVAAVAQQYQLHPNMVFRWIREARTEPKPSRPAQLIEIVTEESAGPEPQRRDVPAPVRRVAPPVGSVEVQFAVATVRLRGEVPAQILREVFTALAGLK